MEQKKLSGEFLSLQENGKTNLNIRDLAARLLINRKEALLLLVTLESQGILIWDLGSKRYRANPDSLRLLLQREERANSKVAGILQKEHILAKAA